MNLRFIPQAVHGALDYAVALTLLISPFLLHFSAQGPLAFWISVIAGAGLIGYSVLTDYRVSAVKLIPFKTHLVFDFFAGAVFVAVAALGPFHAPVSIFYLVMGAAVIAVVLLTDPRAHATAAA